MMKYYMTLTLCLLFSIAVLGGTAWGQSVCPTCNVWGVQRPMILPRVAAVVAPRLVYTVTTEPVVVQEETVVETPVTAPVLFQVRERRLFCGLLCRRARLASS